MLGAARVLATVVLAGSMVLASAGMPITHGLNGTDDPGAPKVDRLNGRGVKVSAEDTKTTPGSGSRRPASSGPRVCTSHGQTVPCTEDGSTWVQSKGCYAGAADGSGLVRCQAPSCVTPWKVPLPLVGVGVAVHNVGCIAREQRWTLAPGSPVDPGVLVEQVVAQMQLPSPAVTATLISTDTNPDAKGLIGLPMWLWTEDRTLATEAGRTRTQAVTDGGLTLTLTARMDRIDVELVPTDEWLRKYPDTPAKKLTCEGNNLAGTVFQETYEMRTSNHVPDSPTCGFARGELDHVGTYTLNVTATYTVTYYTNGSPTPAAFQYTASPSSRPYTFKEVQAIITG